LTSNFPRGRGVLSCEVQVCVGTKNNASFATIFLDLDELAEVSGVESSLKGARNVGSNLIDSVNDRLGVCGVTVELLKLLVAVLKLSSTRTLLGVGDDDTLGSLRGSGGSSGRRVGTNVLQLTAKESSAGLVNIVVGTFTQFASNLLISVNIARLLNVPQL
jgi:hypothetical protein